GQGLGRTDRVGCVHEGHGQLRVNRHRFSTIVHPTRTSRSASNKNGLGLDPCTCLVYTTVLAPLGVNTSTLPGRALMGRPRGPYTPVPWWWYPAYCTEEPTVPTTLSPVALTTPVTLLRRRPVSAPTFCLALCWPCRVRDASSRATGPCEHDISSRTPSWFKVTRIKNPPGRGTGCAESTQRRSRPHTPPRARR